LSERDIGFAWEEISERSIHYIVVWNSFDSFCGLTSGMVSKIALKDPSRFEGLKGISLMFGRELDPPFLTNGP